MGRSNKKLSNSLKSQLQHKSARRRSENVADTKVVAVQSLDRRNDIQPTMKTVVKRIDELHPSPVRTRRTTPALLEALMQSISRFGLLLPLLIDKDDQIVSGTSLWEAARKLGLAQVECRLVEHLDPIEREALSLALNRTGETGEWDLEILRERMIVIESAGIELTSTGFTLPEIDQIKTVPVPAEEEGDDDQDDEAVAVVVSQPGDLFQLGVHRLLCGNALDEASSPLVLDGRQAQAVFSDAPYNCPIAGFVSGLGQHKHQDFQMACGEQSDEEFTSFLQTYLSNCRAHTSEGAVIFACMDYRQLDHLLFAGRRLGLTRNQIATWNKGSGGMGGLYRSASEFIAVFVNGDRPAVNNVQLGAHGRDRTSVWSYPGANRRGSSAAEALADHPTPKNLEMVTDALLDVTHPGAVVLDPFAGSGTTLLAAHRSGRIGCGIELDPKYVDRTIRRWEKFSGERAFHVETGLTFAELSDSRSADIED